MIINCITETIGNTPLLTIDPAVHNIPNVTLYAKLELLNPFGSLKDRIAANILDPDKAQGKIVIESSSGNTAKALASICGKNKLTFQIVTNRIREPEVRDILKIMGTDIEELPGYSECPDPNDPKNPVTYIENKMAEHPEKYFHTNQYFNEKNPEAHEQTGDEIAQDTHIDYFFSILGTHGSSKGISKILKQRYNTKTLGIVTEASHSVPGGRTELEIFEVGLYDKTVYEDILIGDTTEAIDGMLTLIRKQGIPCGPTTGLTFSKIKEYFQKNPVSEQTTVVFLACDRIENHISYIKKHRPGIFAANKKEEEQGENLSLEEVTEAPEIESHDLKETDMIIDIRSNLAYNRSHIPQSLNIPGDMFEDLVQNNIFDAKQRIVLVCPRGTITKRFAALLVKRGYDAYSLKEGFLGWLKKKTKGAS